MESAHELSMGQIAGYLAMVLVPVSGIGVLLVIWLWSLKRQVAIKTRDLRDELELRQKAEARLGASETRNRSLVSAIPDTIFVFFKRWDFPGFSCP